MKHLVLSALIASAAAQSPAWGQCGGNGWSGETTCVSGYVCQSSNERYSQCVARVAASSAAPTTLSRVLVPSSSSKVGTSHASTTPVPSGSFSKATGTKFTIDGVSKYFAGTNSYWIGFLTSNADIDLVMSHLQTSGLKILRVWGFNDVTTIPGSGTVYFQSFSGSTATINTGANGLQRLDYVVQSAQAHGIKLIINFVNNWTDYGGMKAYFGACGVSSNAQWYQTAACQTLYKNYIKAVVGRYKESTAVFAWELANEPRCNGCATTVLTKWINDTSAYIKSLDSNHMVTVGDEGFGLAGDTSYPYTSSEGVDWAANLNVSTIDFGTFHLYPSSWGTTNDWGNAWVTNHAKLCAAANKPCLFEEYGSTSNHCSVEGGWQKTSLAASGMAGDLFWQDGDTLSYGKTSDDGYTVFYGSSDWTCLVDNHVKAIG